MSDKIIIEKDVPLPKRTKLPEFPLDQMEVGHSFVLEAEKRNRSAVRQRIYRYQKDNWPKRFSVRSLGEDRVRIYRIQDYTEHDLLRKML